MVTPHVPPDQAANALLPQILREGLVSRGHDVSLVAFEPRSGAPEPLAGVTYIRRPMDGWARRLRLAQMRTLWEILSKAGKVIRSADVVHLHSNTFMNQVSAAVARGAGRPFILTLYGTEIWHFRRRPADPFLWMNRKAAHVAFYSRLLLERSLALGVVPPRRSVVYPPVETRFRRFTDEERAEARRRLGLGAQPLLLNVKRLHPLAGQRYLLEAVPEIRRRYPDVQVWIAGEGESRADLEARIREKGLGPAVRLLGLVDNRELPRYYVSADLFVLPSLLEAFPTVAAEALACGTPVLTADHPGGSEIRELFPEDVRVVAREDPSGLAREIVGALSAPRRSSARTLHRIENEFRPDAAVGKYLTLYQQAVGNALSRGAHA